MIEVNGTIRILQQKLSVCKMRARGDRISDGLTIDALTVELNKNEKIKDKVSRALQESSIERSKLTSVISKLFSTMQDKIHQLSSQLNQVTVCLEGNILIIEMKLIKEELLAIN